MKSPRCPICGAAVTIDEGKPGRSFPFCSERCRNADLSRWFNEGYTVPVEGNRVIQEALDDQDKRGGPIFGSQSDN